MSVHKRIRHAVVFEPLLGYRALCEIDGERTWVGPWTTEAQADENAAASSQAWRDAIDHHGGSRAAGNTVLGVWTPGGAE